MLDKLNFDLVKTGVILDENHVYWLADRTLKGITGIIKKLVFGDPYANVPQAILDERADFGKAFHEEMELYINTGIEGHSDVFKVFKDCYDGIVKFVKSEYIVTDYKDYASPIDAIDEDEVIWDFKTSTKIDIPYWQWQMGVYCYLYSIVNGRKPKGCKVMWINKHLQHDIFEVEPVSEERAKALLEADRLGTEFIDPAESDVKISLLSDEKLQSIYDIEKMIISLEEQKKRAETRKAELCSGLAEIFRHKGVKSINTDRLTITLKDAYKRKTFDSKAFAADHPEMYIQYQKESNVKESITIKIK